MDRGYGRAEQSRVRQEWTWARDGGVNRDLARVEIQGW